MLKITSENGVDRTGVRERNFVKICTNILLVAVAVVFEKRNLLWSALILFLYSLALLSLTLGKVISFSLLHLSFK